MPEVIDDEPTEMSDAEAAGCGGAVAGAALGFGSTGLAVCLIVGPFTALVASGFGAFLGATLGVFAAFVCAKKSEGTT